MHEPRALKEIGQVDLGYQRGRRRGGVIRAAIVAFVAINVRRHTDELPALIGERLQLRRIDLLVFAGRSGLREDREQFEGREDGGLRRSGG